MIGSPGLGGANGALRLLPPTSSSSALHCTSFPCFLPHKMCAPHRHVPTAHSIANVTLLSTPEEGARGATFAHVIGVTFGVVCHVIGV